MNTLLKEGEELFIKMSNGQFRKIDEVVRFDENQITNTLPTQNNQCHKMQVPEKIAQEVGKIIEQHNGILPRDISVRFVENSHGQKELIDDKKKIICTDEHLLLFIKSHYLKSRGIPVNITIDCDLDETEKELRSEVNSHFNRSLFVLLYIPIFFPIFRFFFMPKNDTSQRELIRILSSSKNSSKSHKSNKNKNSFRKNGQGEKSESLLSQLLYGDHGSSAPPISDKISSHHLSFFQESDDSHNILIRFLFKVFYLITGVSLHDDPNANAFAFSIKPFFERFVSKFAHLLTSESCKELSVEASPTHDHLYSTDEASSSEADFVGPIPDQSGGLKTKKNRKEVSKSKSAY